MTTERSGAIEFEFQTGRKGLLDQRHRWLGWIKMFINSSVRIESVNATIPEVNTSLGSSSRASMTRQRPTT
jgi:hypothetical protein